MRRVQNVMSSTVLTAAPDDLVGPVRDTMLDSGVHCVPVVDDAGHPVGVVSAWDLVEEYAPQEGIGNVMTDKVLTIGPHAMVEEAAMMMRDNFVHHLVVVSSDQVVGIVSSFDLLGEIGAAT